MVKEAFNDYFGEMMITRTFKFEEREYGVELDETGEMVRVLSTGI